MRQRFDEQLALLQTTLTNMGALCEDAIACATKALLDSNRELRQKAIEIEHEINLIESDIEQLCVRLLLRQQPVAGDLRRITAAQKMIIDMERIGDQAADIAEISVFMEKSTVKSDVHIADMARATIKMVTDSIDSFVRQDVEGARAAIAYDDVVDDLFSKVKCELIALLQENGALASDCLDLLMIAKYFERIGDHAQNIAEWVLYSITGNREAAQEQYELPPLP